MAPNNSKLSYESEYETLDRALDSPAGIRIPILDYASGHALQNRLHYARKLDRDESKARLPPDDPMYGKSVYDTLETSRKQVDGKLWVYITQRKVPDGIEELPVEATNAQG